MTSTRGEWLVTLDCKSGHEFLDRLRLSHDRWKSRGIEGDWLFRGQRSDKWSLIPSAWRDPPTDELRMLHGLIETGSYFERLKHSYKDLDKPPFPLGPEDRARWRELDAAKKEERVVQFLTRVMAEIQIINDFCVLADEIGQRVEPHPRIASGMLMGDLIRSSLDGNREEFFEQSIVAIAQHHRAPTRLLDWTFDPIKAAFFAVDGANPGDEDNVVVWGLRREAIQRAGLREYRVPRHVLPFLHAQAGCFVWHPDGVSAFALQGAWPDVASVLEKRHVEFSGPRPLRPWAYRVRLPVELAQGVVKMLWAERVSRAHLMPTFDNVQNSLFATFSWRDEESFLK